jgi:hypothetical protein
MNRRKLILGATALITSPAVAQENTDLALIIADDVSSSINATRFAYQQQGIKQALLSKRFLANINNGMHRNMYFNYMQWSNRNSQAFVGWHKIQSVQDVELFVKHILDFGRQFIGSTGIANAIETAAKEFERLPALPSKKIIDIAGDGKENVMSLDELIEIRNNTVAKNIIINGLPMEDPTEDFDDLIEFYELFVIGGPGAFRIPVRRSDDYANCLLRKLIMETS